MDTIKRHRVKPGGKISLARVNTDADGGLAKQQGKRQFERQRERLAALQERLYAEGKQALLVVFQAMDGAGKDSTIREVLSGVNPQGCSVASFKAPSEDELHHDFLWRVHQRVPRRGHIGVFNRSHYEDVLVVRVRGLAPEETWRRRYEHIVAFEKLLHDEGTRIVKIFLHVSKDYQREALQDRLDVPAKRWKFNPGDLPDRERWGRYLEAYEEAIRRTSTAWSPWYIVPAERHWYRNLVVAQVIVSALEEMDPRYPTPAFDHRKIVIPD